MENPDLFHAQQIVFNQKQYPAKTLLQQYMNKTALTELFLSGKVIMKSEGNTGN